MTVTLFIGVGTRSITVRLGMLLAVTVGLTAATPAQAQEECFVLAVRHIGAGTDPLANPANSERCPEGTYVAGEEILLLAEPDAGWVVGGWRGTSGDISRDLVNSVTMPAGDHQVGVIYVECFTLTSSHTGLGADPALSPLGHGDGSSWSEHTIDGFFEFANEVYAADIDADGDLDVLGSASVEDDITWWENLDGAGTSWSEHTVAGLFRGARSVYAADIDGDGDQDVLGAANSDHEVAWWENENGIGTSWTEHIVAESFFEAESVYAADIDGDGDQDILGASPVWSYINWWENRDGDGTTWVERRVSQGFDGAFSVRAADVDGDGDLDVLGAARFDDDIAWWENVNNGGSWIEHLVDGFFDEAWTVDAADIDGDGDLDVLGAANADNDITWWENVDGAGTSWFEHTVDSFFGGARWVHAADVDTDGDLDVLGAAADADDITWWENLDRRGTQWEERVVDSDFDGADSVLAADIDGDGDLDVLGSAHFADDITWWENLYAGSCPADTYQAGTRIGLTADPDLGWEVGGWSGTDDDKSTELTNIVTMPADDHLVSVEYVQNCFALSLGRIGQGAVPVPEPPNSEGCDPSEYHVGEVVMLTAAPAPGWVVGGWSGTDDDTSRELTNTVTMPAGEHEAGVIYIEPCFSLGRSHTGLGADPLAFPLGDGTSWTEQTVEVNFRSAEAVSAADVDGDGDLDVLGASSLGDITWWENVDGSGTSWAERLVDGGFREAASVHAADVDGDGDQDVLGAARADDEITWWENTTGDGMVWTEHVVDGSFDGAESVYAADIDGDGDIDVLGGARDADDIAWWENRTGDGTVWTEHTVDGDFNAGSVYAADVDGDGDFDVVGALNGITWYENTTGDGSVWTEHLVTGLSQVNSVYAADVDGDGDVDAVGAVEEFFLGGFVAWWENLDGVGTVWVERVVDGSFDGATSVYAADVDGDGDLDLLGAAASADDIAWWENVTGDGTIWTEYTVDGDYGLPASVYAADVDSDGDQDVLGAAKGDDQITWWENTYVDVCLSDEYQSGQMLRLTAAPDPGWSVGGWTGTDDDTSTELSNLLTMPASDHEISVHYVQLGPFLSIGGACPGEITLSSSQLTPLSVFGTFASVSQGNSQLDSGPCAGTETSLDSPFLLRVATADAAGEDSVTRVAGDGVCGYFLQLVDGTTCQPSNVAQIPGAPLLTVSGRCPGDVTAAVSGVVPSGRLRVYAADDRGTSILGETCTGTELELEGARLLDKAQADGEGQFTLDVSAGADFCGDYLQVVDTSTCLASNPGRMPE